MRPHQHWHLDVSYINVEGTFDYPISLLDGCSRGLVHWELRESMTEPDVEIIVQRALEKHPDEKPCLVIDDARGRLLDAPSRTTINGDLVGG